MKISGSWCVFTLVIIAAGFLCLAEVADGANEFRKCYNTSVEMHCFDLQYNTTNNRWLTASFDNGRQRCNNLNSTLLIIEDEETNTFVQNYISDPMNPIRFQNVWMDAYRISDYNNTYTLHWVNSKLPNLAASDVGYNAFIFDGNFYTMTLECRYDNGKPQFYLTAKRPQDSSSYLCEYSVSRCLSTGSNAFQITDICYIPFSASVSWYEARNRCLKDGGDLASFPNVTSVNFTSWLGSDLYVRFWIGLRFSWYIWKDSGQDLKYSKLALTQDDINSPCLVVCSNCNPSFSWFSKDCSLTDSVYVVCHSVTPLVASAVSVVKITTSSAMQTSTASRNEFIPTADYNQQASSRTADGSVGIGLGVGLGVPLVISLILTVFFAVKSKRLETRQKQQVSNNRIALAEVHEPPVVQVTDSSNDHYQELNRNLDNSSAAMYDKLRAVETNQNYEEFSSSAT